MLKDLCTSHGPSGREDMLYPIIENAFKPYCHEIRCGSQNNVYAIKKGRGNGKNSIMLMAHADEVFMQVTGIMDNGFLKFTTLGIDAKTLVSQEVVIHGTSQIIGIIGIKPPHLMNDEEKNAAVKVDDLLIDTGLSKEEAEKNIKIGTYVTLKRDFYELLNDNVVCKALDDRASIVSMWNCAKELMNVNHEFDVYFVCSCQEEVGHRGAKMASYDLNPTLAIAIDVTFDSGKMGIPDKETYLGKGPCICIGPNIHPKFRKRLMELAEEYNIPYQVEVEGGNTGTDAWDIQIVRNAIPTLLISIPQKYMHTSVEMVNMKDVVNTGRIMAKFIEKVTSENLEEMLCF
ncbi:endoglucanase [Hathewaya proteolytica DSM 3090]|uniref:Endoglucanase n=1 Tax=Hathewaya proteolytica DSM 3090 TaxID=1121331 RepID=A0A1M6QN04_9CLOT|nr:endoglucanase [Hathewaya proteolytica DSM 3090]